MFDFLSLADPLDIAGFQQDRRVSNANNAIKQAQKKADANSAANKELYNQFYNKTQSTYGDTAAKVDDYLKNLEGMEAYDPGKFEYTGDVNDFYSKAADLRIKNAMNALRESSDIFSSDYFDLQPSAESC